MVFLDFFVYMYQWEKLIWKPKNAKRNFILVKSKKNCENKEDNTEIYNNYKTFIIIPIK